MAQLFISYRHSQIETVRELEAGLRLAGIDVVRDENEIRSFDSITDTIKTLLADSHAMLVVLSEDYPESRYCQWELTAAYIAAQQHGGKPADRIFVLDLGCKKEVFDALPIELRDAKTDQTKETVASVLTERLSGIRGTFGELGLPLHRMGYGRFLASSPRFSGRDKEMWTLHACLQGSVHTMVTGHVGPDLAEVSGLGGIGKTLLAEEYALRFSAAYPGGIFWLDAYGSFNPLQPDIEAFKQSCVEQFQKVARAFGLSPAQDATIDNLRWMLGTAIEQRKQRCLWIVDDIPTGLAKHLNDIKQWFSPHTGLAPTLVTTRSREYSTIGKEIPLDVLAGGAALQLLKSHGIDIAAQAEDAGALIERLGRHALALDIAGAAIRRSHLTIKAYLTKLDEGMEQLLDVPDVIVAALPTGCEKRIVLSFLHSISKLSEHSLDFLRLAANLAPAPIRDEFVELVFRHTAKLERKVFKDRAELALLGCDNYSLARGKDGFWTVHALVTATVQYYGEAHGERGRHLRSVAMGLLGTMLQRDIEEVTHAETLFIAPEVEHARHLTSHLTNDEERSLMECLGKFNYFRGNPRLAITDWRKILAYDTEKHGLDHPATLTSMDNLASALGQMGEHQGAKALQEHVLAHRKELQGADHPNILTSMNNLASTLGQMGDHQGAKTLQEHVLVRMKELLGPDHPDTLTSMNNLASTLWQMGDRQGEKTLLEHVLERSKELLGPDHPVTLASMNNLATTLGQMGDHHGAKTLQEHVLVRMKELLGPDHPATLSSMNNLALMLRERGDHQGAKTLQEYVLERSKELLGPDHPDTLTDMNNLALTLGDMGDHQGAMTLDEHILARRKELLGADHPSTLSSMSNLASTLWQMGDRQGAKTLLENVLVRMKELLGSDHPATLSSMKNLASMLGQMGDHQGGKTLGEHVLERSKELLGPDHPDTTRAASNLFMMLDTMGEREAAQSILDVHLAWLLDDNMELHSGDLQQIRAMLRRVVGVRQAIARMHAEDWRGAAVLLDPLLTEMDGVLEVKCPDLTVVAWHRFICLHNLDDREGAQGVIETHLRWLLDADPDKLTAEQTQICQILSGMVGPAV